MDSLGEDSICLDLFKWDLNSFCYPSTLNFVFFCVSLGPLEKGQVRNEALRELRVELSKKHIAGELDGFTLYL